MSPLDWILAAFPWLIVVSVGLLARKQVRSVADFVSGNRSAGRYLLAIANGELQTGAVIFAASYEYIVRAGFTLGWWLWLSGPIYLIVNISGFVVYRFRETRALTLAQFFEIRYSRRFRLFAGGLAFLAGICNFGIIPAVGARFLVYFLNLPQTFAIGPATVPTFVVLMAAFLSTALFVALSGGVVTIMLTNCLEGMVSQLFFLVIIAALVLLFPWEHINAALEARPAGHSMLNPFDTSSVSDFNLAYVVMTLSVVIYSTMAWQNAGGYNSAAFSPHEGRMGLIMSRWREMGKGGVVTLLSISAYTFLNSHDYAAQAASAHDSINAIADAHLKAQMTAPIAWAHLLPAGVKGVFCAVLLMGIFGGDATHLHSWGSILVQDIIVPLRRKPFEVREHLRALRLAIVGVALFAFVFGAFFRQTDYILMWWAATQAIFTGGAGAAIIGGLYWKKGTTPAAWSAMITGSVLCFSGIIAQHIYDPHFPWNGVQISFFSTLVAVTVYLAVSLATHREDFNMDRMLHRGAYARPVPETATAGRQPALLARLIGIDSNFTRTDKWCAGFLFCWSMMFVLIFLVGTIWNQFAPWPLAFWSAFWHVVGVASPIFFAIVIGIWFTLGGIANMRDLFRRLRSEVVNAGDDGTVIGGRNRGEADPATAGTNAPVR